LLIDESDDGDWSIADEGGQTEDSQLTQAMESYMGVVRKPVAA
jgi:hypothetical protein